MSGQITEGARSAHAATRTRREVRTSRSGWTTVAGRVQFTGTVVVGLLIELPTETIPNPFFMRRMPTEWWNLPVWLATSVPSGLLVATYVREGTAVSAERPTRLGRLGGLLPSFAIGCPVCSALTVVALVTPAR